MSDNIDTPADIQAVADQVFANPPLSLLGSSLLVRANEGRTLRAFGHAIVVLLDGKQTDGKFTAFLNMTPPGCGPGPHYHERDDEWFYLIEGRASFLLNGTWTDLFPGDCVYSPRGSVHGFKNNTDQPLQVFINIAPAGFEHFFAEAAEVWAQPEPDMSRMATIEEKYGVHGVDATYRTDKDLNYGPLEAEGKFNQRSRLFENSAALQSRVVFSADETTLAILEKSRSRRRAATNLNSPDPLCPSEN